MSGREAVPLVTRARRFAALSGPFDPVALLAALDVVGDEDAMKVAVDLASVCDTSEPEGWLMRGTVRRDQLDTLAAGGMLQSAIDAQRAHPHDVRTGDLLDALSGSGPYSTAGMKRALKPPLERELLTRMAVALDRAGAHAPAHGSLETLRAALGRADEGARADAKAKRGFYGRKAEMKRAEAWLSHPHIRGPVKALLVTGIPGVGKTTLIDEIARRASGQRRPWIVVRLDFDRGGLDIQDRVGFTIEVSRLVARELGPDAAGLRSARLAASEAGSSTGPHVKGAARDHIPDELSLVLGDAIRAGRRPVLLILDTLEALHTRGETHPRRLFETLDALCDRGLQPLSVIAAARPETLAGVPERIGDRIELTGLDEKAADRLLARLDVAPAMFPRIKEVSGGIPFALRVGAVAVGQSGPDALDIAAGQGSSAADHLYRFLASRMADKTLRALALPGLIVRRLHRELIADVLAPHAGLKKLDPDEAATAFTAVKGQDWLVEPDPAPGWLRFKPDVRPTLLENVYATEKPVAMARLNRAVAHWFDRRPEPFAPLEAAYHRLQAMRGGGGPPDLAPEMVHQFDEATLDELPIVAQDFVRIRCGSRSSRFRDDSALGPSVDFDAAAVELELTLERNDIREARHIYDRSFGRASVAPDAPAADVARTYLWRAGRWAEVVDHFDPRRYFDGPFRGRSQTVTLAHFEMWAELRFEELAREFVERPELAALATELRGRGLDGSLGSGALGFALVHAGVPQPRGSWSIADPVEAATSLWRPETRWSPGTPVPQVQDALAMQSDRFSARVSRSGVKVDDAAVPTPRLPDLSTQAGAARVLASATPYVSVVDTLLALDPDSALHEELSRADGALAKAGGIPPGGAGDWHIAPSMSSNGALENLAALGLLAEWLGAAAFALGQPDLTLIAASAERWRRTCAGDWAYSPHETARPAWRQRPDASIRDRVAQLSSERACLDQSRIWSGARSRQDAMRELTRLRENHPAADGAARKAKTANTAAAELLDGGVPSAFVPALAVLGSLEGKRKS